MWGYMLPEISRGQLSVSSKNKTEISVWMFIQSPYIEPRDFAQPLNRGGFAHAEGALYTHMHISVPFPTDTGVLHESPIQRRLYKTAKIFAKF